MSDEDNGRDKKNEKRSYPFPEDELITITLRIKGSLLNHWKERIQNRTSFKNRTDVIKNAMDLKELFLDGVLTGGTISDEMVKDITEMKSFLQSIRNSLNSLIEKKYQNLEEIESELPIEQIPNYDIYKQEIIRVLTEQGTQSIYSLPQWMDFEKKIEGPSLFLVLKRMKDEKIIKMNRLFGWELVKKSPQ